MGLSARNEFLFFWKKIVVGLSSVKILITITTIVAAARARPPREQRRHWPAAILDRGSPVRVAASRSRTRPFSTIIISSLERPRPPAVRRPRRPHNPMNTTNRARTHRLRIIISFFFE